MGINGSSSPASVQHDSLAPTSAAKSFALAPRALRTPGSAPTLRSTCTSTMLSVSSAIW
eukprot:CAMPEP_0176304338 /NCGR_PEP_ID=MMETSP0121_2-20121125/62378_1 /TAXON_ID=160619 /ORGANISM="Kryptoperidinium foliaceum, Strain CCMP 1326" /LENGTH=58 /DNA_ID=CAMNT_0017645939 /DNA_START=118 /DNA_END=291 /DNA_ORIENTATION=-